MKKALNLQPFHHGEFTHHRSPPINTAHRITQRKLDGAILQFSRSGMRRWSSAAAVAAGANTVSGSIPLGRGGDVAIALCITHDIVEDVREYIDQTGTPVDRLVTIRPELGCGPAAVRDGNHALAIVDSLCRLVNKRTTEEKNAQLHVFAAAPNAVIFFLGQLSHGFGNVTLYEYDFERTRGGGYEPSFSLPASAGP